MRSTALHAALALLIAAHYGEAATAPMFPRAQAGDGFLSIPVGTIKRPHKVGKRSAIDATLENMDFFYAIQGEFCRRHPVARPVGFWKPCRETRRGRSRASSALVSDTAASVSW